LVDKQRRGQEKTLHQNDAPRRKILSYFLAIERPPIGLRKPARAWQHIGQVIHLQSPTQAERNPNDQH
jgi:hypothetical protein